MTPTCTQGTNPQFEIQSHGNATILAVSGDLTLATAAAFRAAILDRLTGRPKRLLVDLTRVQGLEEGGLGCLLVTALWARKFGTEFSLIPSADLRDRLTAGHLDGYFVLAEPGRV